MTKKKFYFFIGTTAELIKLAPVIREFKNRNLSFEIIASGQTRILFKELVEITGILKADIYLKEKSEKSSLLWFGVWVLRTLFISPLVLYPRFKKANKNSTYFIVHGDTVSSLIGAIIAKFYGLRLVHIESGLRSFNFLEPFPEEISRFFISLLSDIHFCPNGWAVNNLKNAGGEKVNTYQNTLFESFKMAMGSRKKFSSIKLPINKGKFFVLVVHRQEHVIFGKRKTAKILKLILKETSKNLKCVLVIHKVTENFINLVSNGLDIKIRRRIVEVPRLPYISFMKLLSRAEFLITDGGSNQEEAYYLGIPCLLIRNRTERIEGLGENVLLSKNNPKVIKEFIKNYKKYKRAPIDIKQSPSKIIVDYLLGD